MKIKNLFLDVNYKYNFGTGIKYARFDYKYISEVKNHVGGMLKIFLESFIESYGKTWNRNGYIYINRPSIELIIEEIKYYKKNKKWREVQ